MALSRATGATPALNKSAFAKYMIPSPLSPVLVTFPIAGMGYAVDR
jgi:hypothetical protein